MTAASSILPRRDQAAHVEALLSGTIPTEIAPSKFGDLAEPVEEMSRAVRLATGNGTDPGAAARVIAETYPEIDALLSTNGDWPEPVDVLAQRLTTMELDVRLIPYALHDWIVDVADRMQVPLDYVAVGAMVALSSVVGRRATIRPKRNDDWTVVPNLWGAIVGPPGVLKSPALDAVLEPLRLLDHDAAILCEEERARHESEMLRYDARLSKATADLRNASDVDSQRIVEDLRAGEPVSPQFLRFIVNDSTVEKLGDILKDNPAGVLLYRDELTGFLRSLYKQGRETDRSFYLEAWRGDGSYTSDRIGRGTVRIEHVCVSILGGIQPGPLSSVVGEALGNSIGADGFLQRFQLIIWPDISHDFIFVDRAPNASAQSRAFNLFRDLATRLTVGDDHYQFDDRAQAAFNTWYVAHEIRLRSSLGEHDAILAHLSKYRSLVPSLALLFHLAESDEKQISEGAVEAAIGWVRYLESHARRVYNISESGLSTMSALARKIVAGDVSDGFSEADVRRNGWTGLGKRDQIEQAIESLVDAGWLRPREVEQNRPGPKAVRYDINPRVLK
jgi:hypothetical protein